MKLKVLVTGGNGFIGSHVVRRLESAGHPVRVLAQDGTSLEPLDGLEAEVVRGDLMVPPSLESAVDGVEVIFHLAALARDYGPAQDFLRVNLGGTQAIIDAAVAAGVRRVVLVSSVAVHRLDKGGIPDGHEDLPRNNLSMPYALSKIRAEDALLKAHTRDRIEGVIVRPGLFPFGPQDRTSFLPLVQNLGAYRHVSGGLAVICYSYVENLAHGIALAGETSEAAGGTYVISDGVKITWKAMMDRICDALGVPLIRRSVPFPLAWTAAALVESASRLLEHPPLLTRYRVKVAGRDCYFGYERARRDLRYEPEVTLDEGLRRTVEWLRKELKKT
ncbi:MAG: NAD-dependent epimerase/dehydratase family protein [Deltaproteobacteria bacterium]|nr:NAD-dependent epimerase/dehydratase family protein [Deltaproteobacteria bacterium]